MRSYEANDVGFRAQVGRWYDARHDAELERALRRDVVAEQAQLERGTAAGEPQQALRAAETGHDAEVDLGLAQLCGVGGDAERARHRDLQAAAEREAVELGDHRLPEALDATPEVVVSAGEFRLVAGPIKVAGYDPEYRPAPALDEFGADQSS